MSDIDVIVNRTARRLRDSSHLRRAIVEAAARGGARVHETTSLEELEQVMSRVAARGSRGVVLAGGDGSHMAGVSALARAFGDASPPVVLLPAGTVCTVARNFGMGGPTRARAAQIVGAACAGEAHVVRTATLRVRDDTGGDRVGFIFGAGLVARFFDAYYASRRPGLTTAAAIAARVFVGSFFATPLARSVLEPTRCTLSLDGTPHVARAWTLVLTSVVRDVGLHLLATYRAGEALDAFHAVASGASARTLGPQMVRVLAGRRLRGEPHIDGMARSLRLGFDAPTGPYVLDGDVMTAHEVTVECGPVLSLWVP